MTYSKILKGLFAGISLNAEDLLFLDTFQVKYLPDRVPKKEFSALLRANPVIHRYLIAKHPPLEEFIDSILKVYKPINNKQTTEKLCQDMLWEIADLIIYNKYPEIYDERVSFNWDVGEITSICQLEGKTVVDVGAGSGRLAFSLAGIAKTVFTVEPISSLRRFIRDKAACKSVDNLFVSDGFLDSIPLPDNSVDILMTSNAIGWYLEEELNEIERVIKSGGYAIHLLRNSNKKSENPFHAVLTSDDWNYSCIRLVEKNGLRLKYFKKIIKEQDTENL